MLKEAFWHSSSRRDLHFQHAEVQEKTWESRVWDHIAMWDIGQKTDVDLQETGFNGALPKSAWGKEHRMLGATVKGIGNDLVLVLNYLQSEKKEGIKVGFNLAERRAGSAHSRDKRSYLRVGDLEDGAIGSDGVEAPGSLGSP